MGEIKETNLYALIAQAERWIDRVEPYREDMSETKKAWRLGFAAAMQQLEIAAMAPDSKV